MSTEPEFKFREMPCWRVTPDVDRSISAGRVAYRFDAGIRHERLIGYSVEANIPLLTALLESLLAIARPTGPLEISATSWLEDLPARARQAQLGVPYEGSDEGRNGYRFECRCLAGETTDVLRALWMWSSEFSIRIAAGPPFVSPVEFQMFPEHIDVADISVSAEDEQHIRTLLLPAA
jgi:hypothetical protein